MPTISGSADLRSWLQTEGIYQDTTHSYVKECVTPVISYRAGRPQILKLPCLYGGIRDIGSYIYGNPQYKDLSAYISAVIRTKDLNAFIRSATQANLNLSAFVRSYFSGYKDIVAAIRRVDHGQLDVIASVYGQAIQDLSVSIGAHLPLDLIALLNIIEIRDLPASVLGEWAKGTYDLAAGLYKIWDRKTSDLSAYISSKMVWTNLAAYLNIISLSNLSAYVKGFYRSYVNLNAYVLIGQMRNLYADIHGYDTSSLNASVVGIYGPYDLQAYICVHPYLNLYASIRGKYMGAMDLRAIVEGWYIINLAASIRSIDPVDLSAYIVARGKSIDLGASVIPNIIKLKKVLQISLLEHRDLKALINFQCFGSTYVNLGAYVYTLYKKDLPAFVWPWRNDDGYKNLGAYINAGVYSVEDKVDIRFVPNSHLMYSQLKLTFSPSNVQSYKVFDTQKILFGTFYASNLTATINGILRSTDLSASLTPVLQANYTELPEYVNPKTHEVVIDFNERWRENWKTFVEIMFHRSGPEPFKYFYVGGSNKIYKIDRNRHWTIWASSYIQDSTDVIDRKNVRSKFIFNMSNYTTIDEAVRDLIDRVSSYRKFDLGAIVQSISPPCADLTATIICKFKGKWVKHLGASITGIV